MVRVGLVGFGHLGRIHLSVLQDLPTLFQVAGVYDRNPQSLIALQEIAPRITSFSTYQGLLDASDAIGIIASTPAHFELATIAISSGKSVFIEKPICADLSDALQLEEMISRHPVVLQVGHVERFNPVISALIPRLNSKAIHSFEARRTAPFQQRGAEVSVVLDLMIHDLDLLLLFFQDTPSQIEVEAKQEQSNYPDEVTAKISFANGGFATVFASRITDHRSRAIQINTSENQYILDLLDHQLQETSISGEQIDISIVAHNALRMQWLDFSRSMIDQTEPKVDVRAGVKALRLALEIETLARQYIEVHSVC